MIDQLTDNDKKSIQMFYKKVGIPLQNRDKFSLHEVVNKAYYIKELRDKRIKDLSKSVKDDLLPEAEKKIKENAFTSLIISFFAGFILAILLMVLGPSRK